MSLRYAFIALVTLPLAACDGLGMRGQDQPDAPAHSGPPAVSPLEVPIETGAAEPRAVSTAEASTLNTTAFSARGNDTSWAVDAAGSTAIYKSAPDQRGQAVRVNRLTFAEGVEYVGIVGGSPFALTVRGGACRDGAGQKFPMTATLKVRGRTSSGCASPATAEVAAAVAATKAPAPAAPKVARPAATTPKPPATRPAPATPTTPATPPAATTTPATPPTTTPATPPAATTPPATTTAPAVEPPVVPAPAAPAAPDATVPAPALQLPSTPPSVTPAPDAEAPAAGGE
ncbi:hypothetical protein [Paracoccus sp. (in: a-proteobacteria)]|uniref:hypothetical protein n=1 Tax=Paracoccus sp. TaxID=267 RepID=UPI003A87DBD3